MTKAKDNDKSMNAKQEFSAQRAILVKEHETDPGVMAALFDLEDSRIYFFHEKEDMHFAQVQINSAKQKIRELEEEIAKQKVNISSFNRLIQSLKRISNTKKFNKRGRPIRSEHREQIAREFIQKWVVSLMESLEVKSCGATGGLANLVSSTTERNWRRWLNGDAIPSYSTFENLLDLEITKGKYAGEQLYKVPVTPSNNQMLTFLKFI